MIGLDKYRSPLDVWQEKIGLSTDHEETEAMRWGTLLEGPIRKEYQRRHPEQRVLRKALVAEGPVLVEYPIEFFTQPDRPWMFANVDALLGHDGVLEIKTSGYESMEWDDETIPDRYYCQAQHYLACHDRQAAELAVLFGGRGGFHMEEFHVERDDLFIQELLVAEWEFWKHVESETPPDLIGHPAEGAALNRQWRGKTEDDFVLAGEGAVAVTEALRHALLRGKAEEDIVSKLQNELKLVLGEKTALVLDAETSITWREEKGRVAWKKVAEALGADHELIESHRGTSPRVFRTPRGWTDGNDS